ncbi:GPP34 family phosphoprotein [Streptomyces sp. NBC_00101]|uniref:GOLPH3/VPS74 family protein n=1 Tax=Streptomyces sp. NBC_00101 TaxID=2975651 RepID=UPI0032484F58
MSTARDLFLTAMGPGPTESVGQGDLSLALAGAELIDLIGSGTVAVEDERIVPHRAPVPGDRLLDEAAEALTPQAPYERIEDWLWRRGRDLSAAYQAALEEDGELTRKRGGLLSFGPERVEAADTPARRRAEDRWREREPVLTALASAVGIGGSDSSSSDSDSERASDGSPGIDGEAETAVVAAVLDAVMELEAVRQRRSIENAAYANLWRGP